MTGKVLLLRQGESGSGIAGGEQSIHQAVHARLEDHAGGCGSRQVSQQRLPRLLAPHAAVGQMHSLLNEGQQRARLLPAAACCWSLLRSTSLLKAGRQAGRQAGRSARACKSVLKRPNMSTAARRKLPSPSSIKGHLLVSLRRHRHSQPAQPAHLLLASSVSSASPSSSSLLPTVLSLPLCQSFSSSLPSSACRQPWPSPRLAGPVSAATSRPLAPLAAGELVPSSAAPPSAQLACGTCKSQNDERWGELKSKARRRAAFRHGYSCQCICKKPVGQVQGCRVGQQDTAQPS